MRARVDELKPILQKIVRREAVVQERIELEHIQLNPERLTARGPNAREERCACFYLYGIIMINFRFFHRKREESMSNRVKNLEKLTKEVLDSITYSTTSSNNYSNNNNLDCSTNSAVGGAEWTFYVRSK